MAKITKDFSIEELEEEYDLPWNAISNTEEDQHRWFTVRELIFKAKDGNYWLVHYMDPASEMQEGQDRWMYDPMPAVKVEKRQVIREEWFTVEQ